MSYYFNIHSVTVIKKCLLIVTGFVMIGQALMSIAYHLCPSTTNYQLDVTFLYVMISLGMFKILTNRAPDLTLGLHWQAFYLMIILVVVVIGGVSFICSVCNFILSIVQQKYIVKIVAHIYTYKFIVVFVMV